MAVLAGAHTTFLLYDLDPVFRLFAMYGCVQKLADLNRANT
jgi:hypothetical protein